MGLVLSIIEAATTLEQLVALIVALGLQYKASLQKNLQ